MTLTNPTDDQLNAAFAEKVALTVPCDNWIPLIAGAAMMRVDNRCQHDSCYPRGACPKFTRSMDAVLPHLEKGSFHATRNYFLPAGEKPDMWFVHYLDFDPKELRQREGKARDASLPRACVIALLRSHGVDIILTNGKS